MIQAIQTRYNGYHFRSRLEARWAIFFDAMKIAYVYEPEGFELPDGTRYLPDFWLPQVRMYAEVKPEEFSDSEMAKARLLIHGTGKKLLKLIGWPDLRPYQVLWPIGDILDDDTGVVELDVEEEMWVSLCQGEAYHLTEHRFYNNCCEDDFNECRCHRDGTCQGCDFSEGLTAVFAARSARFEFGESGAT